jgi:hypothetical protein
MKRATISLGYGNQGDDFALHLEKFPGSSMNAIDSMRKQMEGVAKHLGKIAECLSGFSCEGVEVRGSARCLWISAPDEVIDALVAKDLV